MQDLGLDPRGSKPSAQDVARRLDLGCGCT